MSSIDSFYYILNCSLNSKPRFLVKVINQLCLPSLSIQELFDSKFCTALKEDLISLTKYKIIENNDGDNVEQVNRPIESIVGLDFINYEHSSHLVLKSILQEQYSTEFTRYCNFLNKLVIHVVYYQHHIKNYLYLSASLKTRLSDLFDIINKNNMLFPSDTMKCPSTLDELQYFYSNSLLKIDIDYETFETLVLESKYNEFELSVRIATNINELCLDGVSLLMYVSEFGHLDLMKILVENQASVNLSDNTGMTPLIYAISSENIECVQYLLQVGANVNTLTIDGLTPPMYALKNGNVDIFKLLINSGAHLVNQSAENTCLNLSVQIVEEDNTTDLIQLLLDRGVHLDYKDSSGCTALMYAIDSGHAEIVKILSEYGSILDIYDPNSKHLILEAIENNEEIINILLQYNEDLQNISNNLY